jgi:group I intron endonuclease
MLCQSDGWTHPLAWIRLKRRHIVNTVPPHDQLDNPTSKSVFIYALIDPTTNEMHYIGKSKHPKRRLTDHMSLSQPQNEALIGWLRTLKESGLRPTLQILEEVPSDQWQDRECYWIAYYREHNAPLTNIDAGGLHSPLSSSTKAKLRDANLGKDRGPEFSAKMIEVMADKKGKKRPPEVGTKVSATKTGTTRPPFSDEWRKNIAESSRGRKHTPESIEKIAAAKRGKKHSPETLAKMSLSHKKRQSIKQSPPNSTLL